MFPQFDTPGDWQRTMAELIDHLDDVTLPRRLIEALRRVTAFDCSLVLVYREDANPLVLFDDTSHTWRENKVSDYLRAAYLLDPCFIAARDGISTGVYRLSQLAPDGFDESEYYQAYYARGHIEEEVCFLLPVEPGVTVALSLERREGRQRFDATELAQLQSVVGIVQSLLKQHWRLTGARRPTDETVVYVSIQRAYKQFGSSVLTPRECEVVRLLLSGHSTRSLAERLGISAGTAKIHRERIYAKLDISLQSELFHLFIDSLSTLKEEDAGDPLAHYNRRPNRSVTLQRGGRAASAQLNTAEATYSIPQRT